MGFDPNLGLQANDISPKGKRREGPIRWFFSIVLLWILCFPWYMHRRRLYGVKGLVVPAALVALVFLGSWFTMSSAIESKVTELRGMLNR